MSEGKEPPLKAPLQAEGVKAAGEIAKQIITLATGAIAFTVTFLEKFSTSVDGRLTAPSALFWSWGFFGFAIVFALLYLMALNGTLEALDFRFNGWAMSDTQREAAKGSNAHYQHWGLLMLACFVLALITMAVAAVRALDRPAAPAAISPAQVQAGPAPGTASPPLPPPR